MDSMDILLLSSFDMNKQSWDRLSVMFCFFLCGLWYKISSMLVGESDYYTMASHQKLINWKKKRWYMLHLHYIIASTAYLIFVTIFWCDHCCWNIPIHQPHVLPCTIMHRETWLLKNEFISKRRDEFIFFPPTPYIFVFKKKMYRHFGQGLVLIVQSFSTN